MAVALLDPEPVAECDTRTECQCIPSGDIPWRRQKKEVDGEEDGREEVEGEIGHEGQLCPFGEDEVLVDLKTPIQLALSFVIALEAGRKKMGPYRSYAPVQNRNEHFEGRRTCRKRVLGAEQCL